MADRTSASGAGRAGPGRISDAEGVPPGAFWSGPAVPETVRQARNAVTDVAAAGGVSGIRLDDVRTCVSEGVTNAIMHAFGDDPSTGTITVCAGFSLDALTIVITDDGRGFLPRDDSPGLGLGLGLIATVSDAMSVANAPGGGTELSIRFNLADAAPSSNGVGAIDYGAGAVSLAHRTRGPTNGNAPTPALALKFGAPDADRRGTDRQRLPPGVA